MTYMPEPHPQDQIVAIGEDRMQDKRAGTMPMAYKLRRPGARPLSFRGTELGMAMSFSPDLPYWYEVNLYRTADQGFALAIRTFFQSEDEKDMVSAWSFESIGEAIDALEAYDPARDLRIGVDAGDPALTGPELAAHAMALRARTEEARRHFAGLVGEFLHQMDQPG